jgi:hypothetical protein
MITEIKNEAGNVIAVVTPGAAWLIAEFKKLGYELKIYTNLRGQLCANCTKQSAKMKWPKNVFSFFYGSNLNRAKSLVETLAKWNAWEQRKQDNKAEKKQARENFTNPYQVGQVFYDSWGYDQTNVDFYQIVEVKPKSVVLREIASFYLDGSRVKPMPGTFTGEAKIKPIQLRVYDGKANHYINGERGSISLYDAGDKGLYYSTYH